MRELIYTLLELEWEFRNRTCDFCSNRYGEDNKSVNQIRTRSKATNKLIANDMVCEECKDKFENDELPKCERCGRLQNKTYVEILCRCIRNNEDLEEKEVSPSPPRESMFSFYERQINGLREELNTAEETIEMEREVHEDAMKAMNKWYTKYQNTDREDLLKRVAELEEEVKRLKEENGVESYEKEELEQQQTAQIEVPAKRKKH